LAERRELRSLGLARPDLNRLTSKSSSMSGGCHLRKTASSGGPALGLRSPSTVRNDSSDTWRVGQPGTVVPVASRSTATSAWFRGLDAAEGELLIVASRVSRSPCRAVAGARSRAHSQSSSVAAALMCRWAAMTWLRVACAPTGRARTPGAADLIAHLASHCSIPHLRPGDLVPCRRPPRMPWPLRSATSAA